MGIQDPLCDSIYHPSHSSRRTSFLSRITMVSNQSEPACGSYWNSVPPRIPITISNCLWTFRNNIAWRFGVLKGFVSRRVSQFWFEKNRNRRRHYRSLSIIRSDICGWLFHLLLSTCWNWNCHLFHPLDRRCCSWIDGSSGVLVSHQPCWTSIGHSCRCWPSYLPSLHDRNSRSYSRWKRCAHLRTNSLHHHLLIHLSTHPRPNILHAALRSLFQSSSISNYWTWYRRSEHFRYHIKHRYPIDDQSRCCRFEWEDRFYLRWNITDMLRMGVLQSSGNERKRFQRARFHVWAESEREKFQGVFYVLISACFLDDYPVDDFVSEYFFSGCCKMFLLHVVVFQLFRWSSEMKCVSSQDFLLFWFGRIHFRGFIFERASFWLILSLYIIFVVCTPEFETLCQTVRGIVDKFVQSIY